MAHIYTDHNVSLQVAVLLRALGHRVLTAREAGRDRASDDEHLLLAAQSGSVLITGDWKDFRLLHSAWQRWSVAWHVSSPHAGILVVPQRPEVELARAIASFFALGLPTTNELYYWRPSSGWNRRT